MVVSESCLSKCLAKVVCNILILLPRVVILLCIVSPAFLYATGAGSVDSLSFFIPNTIHSDDLTEEDFSEYFDVSGYDVGYYDNSLARNLSFMRYRYRGYDSRWSRNEAMGLDFSDISDGYTYWNVLQGVRNLENINRTRFTAAGANRNYAGRFKYSGSYDIGQGNAVSASADRRWGENGFVDGLFSEVTTISLSASLGGNSLRVTPLIVFTSGEYGVRSAGTQEVYDLAGDNYYNPNSGVQNGDDRTAKTRSHDQGLVAFRFDYKISEELSLKADISAIIGTSVYSLPAWYDTRNPYPDYYRYLPGFFGSQLVAESLAEAWKNGDPGITQMDWARIYETNLYSNSSGTNLRRSHYIMKDLVTWKSNGTYDARLEYRNSGLEVAGGFEIKIDRSKNYAKLNDLLGGDYWLDTDQYMLYDEYYGDLTESNMRDPGRKVVKGDKFGYNYEMNTRRYKLNTAASYIYGQWRFEGALSLGRTSYRREGKYEKQNFPGNQSYGKSRKEEFNENRFEGKATLNLPFRSSVSANVTLAETAPLAGDIFTAPEYRNHIIDGAKTVKFSSLGLSYRYVSPVLAAEVRGYYSTVKDGSDIINYYDDLEGSYVTLAMTGIDKVYSGVEVVAEVNPAARFSLAAMASYNTYKYDSDPSAEISDYTSGKVMLSGAKSFMNGRRLATGPQTVASAQARYRFRWWWMATLTANYAGNNYVSMNPVRRMRRVTDVAASRETLEEMLSQEKLDNAFTLDASLSKEFRFSRNRNSIGIWLSAQNVLNNKDIRYTGYEQTRLHRTSRESGSFYAPFKSKYLYAYGASYYVSVTYKF